MKFSTQRIIRHSASSVEYGPIQHVSDAAHIAYPLTGDFAAGENDSIVERMKVGDTRVFSPSVDWSDTHIRLSLIGGLPSDADALTSVRVRRIA